MMTEISFWGVNYPFKCVLGVCTLFYCMFGSCSKAVGIGGRLHKVFSSTSLFAFPLLFSCSLCFSFHSAVFIFACPRVKNGVFQQHKWFPVLMTVSPLPNHTDKYAHT